MSETIAKAWRMRGAEAEVVDMNKDCHIRLREAKDESCADISCTWFDRAVEVLTLNNHDIAQYSQDIYNCLDKGRSKDRNVMLIGPQPLQLILGKNFSKTWRVLSLAGWAFKMPKSFSFTDDCKFIHSFVLYIFLFFIVHITVRVV